MSGRSCPPERANDLRRLMRRTKLPRRPSRRAETNSAPQSAVLATGSGGGGLSAVSAATTADPADEREPDPCRAPVGRPLAVGDGLDPVDVRRERGGVGRRDVLAGLRLDFVLDGAELAARRGLVTGGQRTGRLVQELGRTLGGLTRQRRGGNGAARVRDLLAGTLHVNREGLGRGVAGGIDRRARHRRVAGAEGRAG